MKEKKKEKRNMMVAILNSLLAPLNEKLEIIDSVLTRSKQNVPKYYRNEDLKELFGLSSNTIIKYRQNGTIPFTRLGDIFLYEAGKINQILKDNTI